jgi:hypothetical protein
VNIVESCDDGADVFVPGSSLAALNLRLKVLEGGILLSTCILSADELVVWSRSCEYSKSLLILVN